jgi:hypothetical protein
MRRSMENTSTWLRTWMAITGCWLFSRHAKDRSPEEWGAVVKR